jgi:hypothetical protein
MKRNKEYNKNHKGFLHGEKMALSACKRKEWIDHNMYVKTRFIG